MNAPEIIEGDVAIAEGRGHTIARRSHSTPDSESVTPSLIDRVLAEEIDPASPPPPSDPRYLVVGRITGTAGNLGQLSSRAKTGKSAVIGAHVSACMKAEGLGDQDADTLGISATPPGGHAVAVIDTEQAPEDACALITRSLRRVNLRPDNKPAWLRAFPLAGFGATELSEALPQLIERMYNEHGGIHSVLIDGGADFATNVNDPHEASALVASWHALAIKYRFHLLVVIHSNEGSQADDTARGWLGKQLRRKAESNLQLRKDGEVITLFGETGQRRAPIPQSEGPAFIWNNEQAMHVLTAGNPVELQKIAEAKELADEVFASAPRMRWVELIDAIRKARDCSRSTAERRVKTLRQTKAVKNVGFGFWEKALP
jgi:hypothetical protein